MNANGAVLVLDQLKKLFRTQRRLLGGETQFVHAVDEVSLSVPEGSTMGIVGESGCGKSTLAHLIVGLEMPTSGGIMYRGDEMADMSWDDRKQQDLHRLIQIVFQDPADVLSPRKTVKFLIAEPMLINGLYDSLREAEPRVKQLMKRMQLGEEVINRVPHKISGGQRQRVALARALSVGPDLLILDEPTSALDVSVQARILNLCRDLQQQESLTYILISHDIGVIEYLCDDVAVMYLGEVVEILKAEEMRDEARHPYTKALLQSSLAAERTVDEDIITEGEPPSPVSLPEGCRFYNRCPEAVKRCAEVHPELVELADGGACRCHLVPSSSAEQAERS